MRKKATKQKKPIYKKWWFWAILVLVVLGAAGGGEAEPDAPAEIETAPPQVTQQATEPVDIVGMFIDRYNSTAAVQIADVSELDVQGDDYRVEYRLQSFDDAVGQKGTIGNGTIEIINYRDSIRVYATTDTVESAKEIIYTATHIIDSSMTDDEIAEQFRAFEHTGSCTLSPNGYFETDYGNGGIIGYKIMVDGSAAGLMK